MDFNILCRLLLVSPFEEDKNFLENILPKNWDIIYTKSAQNAVKILVREHIDIVCSEIQLENHKGIDFLKEARSLFSSIPFVFFYKKIKTEDTIEAVNLGVNRLLKKPLQGESTSNILQNLIKTDKVRYSQKKASVFYLNNTYQTIIKSNESSIYKILDTIDHLVELIYQDRLTALPEIKMAIYEGLINAWNHGNENQEKKIYFSIAMFSDRIIIHIKDEGKGFDYHKKQNFSEKKVGYHGLGLIKYLMDEISFNIKGNEISMLKII